MNPCACSVGNPMPTFKSRCYKPFFITTPSPLLVHPLQLIPLYLRNPPYCKMLPLVLTESLASLAHGFFCSRKSSSPPGANSYLHAKDQPHAPSGNGNASVAHRICQISCTEQEFPTADSSHIPLTLAIYWPVTVDCRSPTGSPMSLGGHLESQAAHLCSSGNTRPSLFRCLSCGTL